MVILINNLKSVGSNNLTILQYLKWNGYDVPRFCFHEKLDIAGNCRMCLVEIEGIYKPIASCTVKVTNNISIYTNTIMVRKARQAILEYLLLSHPLDCPVCDQGGECDLQDQTLIYGPDRGRFFSRKKSIYDFNLGPFIKTTMTRCINCTKCIRFLTMFTKTYKKSSATLGHVGRGNEVYIGQYFAKFSLSSELSGNIIDLCPVGALTSKAYNFIGRSWEEINYENFDIYDTALIGLRISVRDNKILRILPNVDVTDTYYYSEWITDLTRFSFDGYNKNRLLTPMKVDQIKNTIYLWNVSWDYIFQELIFFKKYFNNLYIFLGEYLNLETLITLKDHLSSTGLNNISYTDNDMFNEIPFFDFRFQYLDSKNILSNLNLTSLIITVGVDLRMEMPIHHLVFKQRLRANYDKYIFSFGSKSLSTNNVISNNIKEFISLLEGKSFICNLFNKVQTKFLIYNNTILNRFDNFSLFNLLTNLYNYFDNIFFHVKSTTILNGIEIGLRTNIYSKINIKTYKSYSFFLYYLNVNPFFFKNFRTIARLRKLGIYQGKHCSIEFYDSVVIDYLLPSLSPFEKKNTFISERGCIKFSEKVVTAKKTSQWDDWRIITYLFKLLRPKTSIYNLDIIYKRLYEISNLNYKYFLGFKNFFFLTFVFSENLYYNVPFLSFLPNLLSNSNIVSKHSLLMKCSYQMFYSENKSIYIN